MMLETGMRCGEVYRIKRDEVFISEDYLKVTKSKTKSLTRRIYLSDKAKNVPVARVNRFDGENLFPQNDIDGQKTTGGIIHLHLKTALLHE